MKDEMLREQLVQFLQGRQAHLAPRQVLEDIEPELRTERAPWMAHTIWELLEHMRIAQEDILRYTLDPGWVSPDFPGGYWPPESSRISRETWDRSIAAFHADTEELAQIARRPDLDLCAPIPHGGEHTYLREIMIAADHNAYHLGQIVMIKKGLVG